MGSGRGGICWVAMGGGLYYAKRMIYLKDKVLGMLWGLHAGDSLGAPFEFLPPSARWNEHTEIVGGGKFNWRPGEATDDTDLMLALLRSIQNPHLVSFESLKKEMLAWFKSEPPDIGTTTIKGLRNLELGLPLKECGFVDNSFQGNGSLMRVAPLSLLHEEAVGVYFDQQFVGLAELLEVQTKMTHGHQHCVDSDRVLVAALKVALAGGSKQEIYDRALTVAQQISPTIYTHLSRLPSLSWESVATSGFCVETLSAGLWAFLHYDNLEDSLVAVINRGDDSDSCGAVAGALCGAYYGAASIPDRWLALLEFRTEIEQVLEQKKLFS